MGIRVIEILGRRLQLLGEEERTGEIGVMSFCGKKENLQIGDEYYNRIYRY